MKLCTVLRTNNDYRIGSNGFTPAGFGISKEPFFNLSINDSKDKIISAIFGALNANSQVAQPKDLNIVSQNFLKGMGFRSLSDLHKKAQCCVVQANEKDLYIIPTENEIGKKGFNHLSKEKEIVEINSSIEIIFEALSRAFNKCR